MPPRGPFLALVALAGACVAPARETFSGAAGAELAYRLRFDPSAAEPSWQVEIVGTGFAGAQGIRLELDDWGEWRRLDDYYLRGLEAEPPLVRLESRKDFELAPPPGWDGSFRVRYALAVLPLDSPVRETYGLLPYRAPSYSLGVSSNTLMDVSCAQGPATIARTLTFDVPREWTVFTGYSGVARPGERVPFEPDLNTSLGFGQPVALLAEPGLELVQWGGARDVVAELAAFARTFLAGSGAATGIPVAGTVRLVATEPGFGGTHLDGAITFGCPEGLTGDAHAGTLHFLAHELFHDWLGGRIRPQEDGEGMAWFWEGFTEYLALWNLVRAGLVSEGWFAQRLGEHERSFATAAGSGTAAFADPAVEWRSADNEPVAYFGGALTALALDVALRGAGKAGLAPRLAELAHENGGRFTRASLQAWVERMELGDVWQRRFVAPASSTLAADLAALGFVPGSARAAFAYVGLRLDQPGPFGTVVAIDAHGPAQGIVQVGDRVSGLVPTRGASPVPEGLASEFPFGLDYYEPSATRVRLDVERGAEHHQLWLEPRQLEGDVAGLVPGARVAEFFR